MPGVLTAAAAFSSTRSPSSFVTPGCTAPNTRTELRCWNRVSARGAVVASMRVNVETGTSWPEGVLIFRSDLKRLAGVVHAHARSVDGRGGIFEHPQPFFLRDTGLHGAEHTHRIALLESRQRARCGRRLDARERRDRYELA